MNDWFSSWREDERKCERCGKPCGYTKGSAMDRCNDPICVSCAARGWADEMLAMLRSELGFSSEISA